VEKDHVPVSVFNALEFFCTHSLDFRGGGHLFTTLLANFFARPLPAVPSMRPCLEESNQILYKGHACAFFQGSASAPVNNISLR
jgi:hypothetical protein